MTSVWFDFTGFPGKVAELNRLHKLVCETSELRWRTRKAEDVAHWEDAVARWKNFSGFGLEKFYIFENNRFLAALSGGEAEARACAVTFLEFDPYYYRSGYMKSKLLVRLKHLTLRESEKKRMRKIVRDAILSPRPKCEFKDYARLLKNIGTPEFRQVIRNLPVPDVPYLSARRSCCLLDVYWKSS